MEKIKRFFWVCSGADRTLLLQCKTESTKYAGIGATIFFTGIFAWMAASYALFTVFNNIWVAIAAGFVWGLMIFNLDRYIVSSMRKEGKRWKEWTTALPRIMLALLISIIIAKPLELKIFEKEINAELKIMDQQTIQAQENEVKNRFDPERDRLLAEINALKAEVETKTQKRDELNKLAREEADGTGGTKKRNAGPIYKIKKAEADQASKELEELKAKNENLITGKLKAVQKNDSTKFAELNALTFQELNGPAARLEALDRITAESSAIWWANWFVILLFIAVETAPVLVKLISPAGPYDYLLKVEEHNADARHVESIAKNHSIIKEENQGLSKTEMDYLRNQLDMRLNQS
jgi:hypothetical protein